MEKVYIRIMIDDDEETYTTKKFGQMKEVMVPYEETANGSNTSS